MPSLLGQTVAANYGRMTAQQTYGVGENYSQFGTRQYRFIKVTAVTGNTGSTSAVNFATNATLSLSAFSVAVRALQIVGEISFIFAPGTAGFIAVVAEDTTNDSNTDSNTPGGYGDVEAAILAALDAGSFTTGTGRAATVVSVTADSTGIALA